MVEWSLGDLLPEFCPTTPGAAMISAIEIENLAKNHLKMISSETAGSNGPKLW
jgi:hypothetical protein